MNASRLHWYCRSRVVWWDLLFMHSILRALLSMLSSSFVSFRHPVLSSSRGSGFSSRLPVSLAFLCAGKRLLDSYFYVDSAGPFIVWLLGTDFSAVVIGTSVSALPFPSALCLEEWESFCDTQKKNPLEMVFEWSFVSFCKQLVKGKKIQVKCIHCVNRWR